MADLTNHERIDLYRNLFRGREDVFAMRWQSADGNRKGYTPVCVNEWKQGVCFKLNRGRCRECQNKEYAIFDDMHLVQHLSGKKAYGVYPLLKDGSSYFIAIDFDGKKWQKDAQKFIKCCQGYNLEPHIERSFSGDGCHFWFFFKDKYPAERSRLIFQTLLENAKLINTFDKDASFDRIFPCQDFVDRNGIGNLILLPLQGNASSLGNTVFLDSKDLNPIVDQWQYLKQIRKIKTCLLDDLYVGLSGATSKKISGKIKKLAIEISSSIILHSKNIPPSLAAFLKENLNFINPEYLMKKRMGVSTYNLEKYYNFIESKPNQISLPRGFWEELVRFLDEQNISFDLTDNRAKFPKINFESSLTLHDYQKQAMNDLLLHEQGLLVARQDRAKP